MSPRFGSGLISGEQRKLDMDIIDQMFDIVNQVDRPTTCSSDFLYNP
jgi:hypothetical protein